MALAYGISRTTMLATSVLAVGQEAASSAAHEGTTGNLSLGNSSFDTHRFATLEGRQIRTSAFLDQGRYTEVEPSGAISTITKDGSAVLDAGPATSNIPAARVILANSVVDSAEDRLTKAESVANNLRASVGSARSAATGDAVQLMEGYRAHLSTVEGSGRTLDETERRATSGLTEHIARASEISGLSHGSTFALMADAGLRGSFKGLGARVGAGISYKGETVGQDRWERMKDYMEQHNVVNEVSQTLGASRNWSESSTNDEVKGLSESFNSSLTKVKSWEEAAGAAWEEQQVAAQHLAEVRSTAQTTGSDLSQPFRNWVAAQPGQNGQPIGDAKAADILTPRNMEDAVYVRELADRFVREEVGREGALGGAEFAGKAGYRREAARLDATGKAVTDVAHAGWSGVTRMKAEKADVPSPGQVEGDARAFRIGVEAEQASRAVARESEAGRVRGVTSENAASIDKKVDQPVGESGVDRVVETVTGWVEGAWDSVTKPYGTARNKSVGE